MATRSGDPSRDMIPVKALLIFISGGTLIGMTLYESIKELLLPTISKWESHLITIAVTVLLVTILTAFILRRHNDLLSQVNQSRQKADNAIKHLASIIESSNDAILSIDSTGTVISWNCSAEKIFGMSAAEIAQYHVDTPLLSDTKDPITEIIGMVQRGESVHHLIRPFFRKDGEQIYLSLTASILPSQNNHPPDISIIARDISDQVAKEEIQKILSVKQQLLSSITMHDMKNSLQILLGYCSILEDETEDATIIEIIRRIEKQSLDIHHQIDFMKDYESLGMNMPAWYEAEDLFKKAISSIRDKKIDFQIHLSPLEIYGDPLLEKVIYNLCDNALRYEKNLTIIRTYYRNEGDTCSWIIEDDGIGIRTERKEKIFQRGYGSSSGLGLYFIREILSVTGIGIQETGVENKGARFEITIPSGLWRENYGIANNQGSLSICTDPSDNNTDMS
ncbi:MAG: PAS domain-containing sensor histidine kinase [Methanospirillaceae archaeon]|nr:PAS domain-containing sensor histidine kinase [Methanospirillaceae archaeon]